MVKIVIASAVATISQLVVAVAVPCDTQLQVAAATVAVVLTVLLPTEALW